MILYGATGFTAGLILDALRPRGIEPILCARNAPVLARLSAQTGLESRVASVTDPDALVAAFRGSRVILNAAGPFGDTVDPVLGACLRVGAHYIDISGEVDSIERAAAFHHDARERGITILCGAGFDVVPSDCLLAHVTERLGGAHVLRLAVSGLELVSRGSMRSLANELGHPARRRRQGVLEAVSPGDLQRSFDFGRGPATGVAVTWGDLATAHYSTGVLNVETYFEATPSIFAVTQASRMFGGWLRSPAVREAIQRQARVAPSPTDQQRAARRTTLVAQAEDARGRTVSSRLSAPEAYTLTAQTASAILERFRDEDVEPGFQTPSRLFGADFILDFEGVDRVDSAS